MPVPYGGLLPSGRPISFGTIQAEWDGVTPITMSEYYTQAGVATASSTISLSNFYGKSATTLPSGSINYGGSEGYISIITAPVDFPTSTGYTGFVNLSRTGDDSAAGVKSNGTLWAWGVNKYGNLGKGTTIQYLAPSQVGALTTWRYVSISSAYAEGLMAAIRTDGTLWTCGDNSYGSLGNSSSISRSSPVQVAGSWTHVNVECLGSNKMHGIKTGGTLWHWGSSDIFGDAGRGVKYAPNTSSPIQIGADTTWKYVESKGYSTVAIKTNGTLWACGESGSTPLALGHQSAFVQVGTDTDWWKISQGGWHGHGIKHDGTMYSWGRNEFGSCGTGTTPFSYLYSPTLVKPIGQYWRHVSAGQYSSVAVNMDGSVWGTGLQGQRNLSFEYGYRPVTGGEVSQWTQLGSSTTWKWVSNFGGAHGILG